MKRHIYLLVCILLLGGCADLLQSKSKPWHTLKPDDTDYVLACLKSLENIGSAEFKTSFQVAEADLQYGSDQDILGFICISLHEKADYSQFQQGKKVLEQYINEHPDTSDNFKGLKFLVDRIEEEIITKWSAWKSLREERNELKTEVGTLQKQIATDKLFIGELQEQIEQLKNIENIIESRETEQK